MSVFSITQAERGSSVAITELSPSAVRTVLKIGVNQVLALTFSSSCYREEAKHWCGGQREGGREGGEGFHGPSKQEPSWRHEPQQKLETFIV